MHILILPSWYPSNPSDINGSFFREQALALQKHNCTVGVVYPQLRSLRNWKSIFLGPRGTAKEIDDGIPTFRCHGTNWFPRFSSAAAWHWVKRGMDTFDRYVRDYGKPDIIHVHSALYAGCLAVEIFKIHKIPFVITEHSTSYARGLISKNQKKLSERVSEKAKCRIAVSLEFARLLKGFHESQSQDWIYIPNIVSKSFTDHRIKPNKAKSDYTFINIALLSDKKAVDNLIIAFSKLLLKSENIILKIGGDGPALSKLKCLTNDLAISDKVIFLGSLTREQVLAEVANADAFVLPSRYETFGVVVIEALALGKPVVATRCGGPESIIREGDGLLVPVDDIESLADAMWTLYKNPGDYEANRIRKSCIDRFSEDTIASRLKSVYEEILVAK
ncbi:glycosyltransferase [Pseudomonas mandelii]|uniref:glycosyltransferase n=1 Tax=Pseudomonas mandelii TaxID=75612 RepID=UPI00224A5468|nr:glycosyltransferase [Pseudomonas mandelii]MCX2897816.1 glycosyltransferase [Pseudomonas mandelii]